MKKLLNTLYVTTQGAYLSQEGETVLVRVERETRLRLPIHALGGIVCFGQVACSPPLLGLCGQRDVGVSFFSEHGRFLARVAGPISGNVLLRRAQYRASDDPARRAALARAFVCAKVANSRVVLQRALRDAPDRPGAAEVESAIGQLAQILIELRDETLPVNQVRGFEGEAAAAYFGVFDRLIGPELEAFRFRERSRRPPLDPINALLSFVYTILAHDVASALESVGLDPQVGFLHADRSGRPGLALDIMEEFRPFLADRLVLSLVNLRQVQGKDFATSESGAVVMKDDTRKTLLAAWQQRKQEEMLHPFLEEKAPIGLFPFLQAQLLARHLRGDLDGYPPFFWK